MIRSEVSVEVKTVRPVLFVASAGDGAVPETVDARPAAGLTKGFDAVSAWFAWFPGCEGC